MLENYHHLDVRSKALRLMRIGSFDRWLDEYGLSFEDLKYIGVKTDGLVELDPLQV